MGLTAMNKALEDLAGTGDQMSSGSLTQNKGVVFLTESDTSHTMGLDDKLVRVDGTTMALTITLPSVMEAAGMIFAVTTVFTGGSVTIEDKGGDAALGDITCTTAYTYVFFSTGYKWCKLFGAATT